MKADRGGPARRAILIDPIVKLHELDLRVVAIGGLDSNGHGRFRIRSDSYPRYSRLVRTRRCAIITDEGNRSAHPSGPSNQLKARAKESINMVEKTIALTGISANSIEDAVGLAVARAGVTISGIHTAHVTDTSAVIENNKVVRWKVSVRLTFAVKDQLHE